MPVIAYKPYATIVNTRTVLMIDNIIFTDVADD